MREKDENDRRLDYAALLRKAKPDMETELTPQKFEERDDACQHAISVLGDVLRDAAPDLMVVLGDDQHEQFQDDNMPMFAIYHGDGFSIRRGHRPPESGAIAGNGGWQRAQNGRDQADPDRDYPGAPDLAAHLISSLCDEGFDITRCSSLRADTGIGHAFSFVYRRLDPEGTIPMVPFMVNTYYPPNAPTAKRCYALGQALRQAIEAWDSDKKVAILASGGLSHVIIDEDIDRTVIDAMMEKDADTLRSLPADRMVQGTSEIRNWVIAAGALEPLPMTLVDYVTTYRSPGGTGVGAAFAYWKS